MCGVPCRQQRSLHATLQQRQGGPRAHLHHKGVRAVILALGEQARHEDDLAAGVWEETSADEQSPGVD